MRFVTLSVAAILAAAASPAIAQTVSASGRLCHLAAAHPEDATRPADIAGVALDKINSKTAIPACEAALVEQPDQSVYMFNLGRALEATEQVKRARELYERAAHGGHILAMNSLGAMKFLGVGGSTDCASARVWFESAAAAGNPRAMTNLGFLLQEGLCGAKDYAAARRWYEKAAQAGNAPAMFYLGHLSRMGLGTAKRSVDARSWFAKAAAGGLTEAMVELGRMYASGEGGARNRKEARRWLAKAAEAGDQKAAEVVLRAPEERARRAEPATVRPKVARAPAARRVSQRRPPRALVRASPPPLRQVFHQGPRQSVAYGDAPAAGGAVYQGRTVRMCMLPNGMAFYCF
jgi:TPR repeat protein